MVTTLAGGGLCGVQERLDVVGNRDHGEEDEDEHCHRGKLGSQAGATGGRDAEPKAHNKRRQQSPSEIQEGLHALVRFYTSAGWFLKPDGLGEGTGKAERRDVYPVLLDDFEAARRRFLEELAVGIEIKKEGAPWFDPSGESTYDEWVGFQRLTLCEAAGQHGCRIAAFRAYCPLVQRLGQLPLEQHIGVRIPGGQPRIQLHSLRFSAFLDVPLLDSTFTYQ